MVESQSYFPYRTHHYYYKYQQQLNQNNKEITDMAQQTGPITNVNNEKIKADKGTENLIPPHQKNTYENFDSQLGEWSTRIESYKEKISKFSDELQNEATEQIEELEKKYKEATQRMSELKDKGALAKDEMKVAFEKAWKELSLAFENIKKSLH